MNFLFFLFFLCLIQDDAQADPLEATQILIRTPMVSETNFTAYAEAHHDLERFSTWWLRHRLPSPAEKELRARLEKAQQEFLGGSLSQSSLLFAQVAELALTEDWRQDEQKVFAYVNLRRAQLENKPDLKEKYVDEACRHGDVKLDSSLFPPPLWREYQQRLKNTALPLTEHFFDQKFPSAQYLLIDGQPWPTRAVHRLREDTLTHRFTVVYDHAPPSTAQLTWTQFYNWNPLPISWIEGSCEHWNWLQTPPVPNGVLYFSDSCVKNHSIHKSPSPDLQPLKLHGAWAQQTQQKTNLTPITWALDHEAKSEAPSPLWKNKWLWTITGALVVGYFVLDRQSSTRHTPSTSYGF